MSNFITRAKLALKDDRLRGLRGPLQVYMLASDLRDFIFHHERLDKIARDAYYQEQYFPKALDLMQEFCDRCDKGEVRSKTTYVKFKEILVVCRPEFNLTRPENNNDDKS